jgi:hypothetical protein
MTKTRTALLALTAITGLAVGGAASAETTPLPARQTALGADHFHARAQILDDPLDVETVISSERGFQTGKGLFRAPSNDNHLRAVVDKRSGATRFEVRQVLTYMGPVRGYGEVAYENGSVARPNDGEQDQGQRRPLLRTGSARALPRGDRLRCLRKRTAPRRRRAGRLELQVQVGRRRRASHRHHAMPRSRDC